MSAQSPCFERSTPSLPTAEKVRPFLNNGEEGRRIYDAVTSGDIDTVERMVRANPALLETHRVLGRGERASNGNTGGLLTFAITNCDARMVGALLELGADPDGVPPGNALTYAVLADDPLMATMLLQAGASPDAHSPARATPLKEVLYYERSDAVDLLAKAGADVNRPDAGGDTPLISALRFGDYRSADVLMRAGANPWAVGNKGALPATMLMEPASGRGRTGTREPGNDTIRERLLATVRERASSWPPPERTEIVRRFASGAWPTDAMREAGFAASPEALSSIRQVADRKR